MPLSCFVQPRAQKGPTRHLLIITTEAAVWVPTAFSLYHTRNTKPQSPNAPAFNPQLWQFTQVVGDDVLVEFHASQNADPKVVGSGIARTLTPIEAVEALLVNRGWLQDAQAGQDWKGTSLDLSIVVSARHHVSIPTLIAQGGTQPNPTIVQHGLLPLCNSVAKGQSGMSGDEVVFDPARKDFAVDFTWTSCTNTEILRITDVIVQFDARQTS